MRAEAFAEHLVGRMRQVLCPVVSTAKGHNETVGKSLLEILHAYIRAPFEIVYRLDPVRKCTESSLDLANLRVGCAVLELEQHDMTQQAALFFNMNGRGGFVLIEALALVDMDTAGQNYRPGSQTQKIPYH